MCFLLGNSCCVLQEILPQYLRDGIQSQANFVRQLHTSPFLTFYLSSLPPLSVSTSFNLSFCCVYLAFKIDEYVVSVDQFGNTITPDLRQDVVQYVLSHEVYIYI